jgi:hypothetical protein
MQIKHNHQPISNTINREGNQVEAKLHAQSPSIKDSIHYKVSYVNNAFETKISPRSYLYSTTTILTASTLDQKNQP